MDLDKKGSGGSDVIFGIKKLEVYRVGYYLFIF
jgi:hypothetical protein